MSGTTLLTAPHLHPRSPTNFQDLLASSHRSDQRSMSSATPEIESSDSANVSTAPTSGSKGSTASLTARRLGYTKPAAPAPFAASARARSSVMSLPGIDHLQHYFARAKTARQLGHHVTSRLPAGCGKPMHGMLPEEDNCSELGEDLLKQAAWTPLPPSPIQASYARHVSGDVDPRRRRIVLQEKAASVRRILQEFTDVVEADQSRFQELEGCVTSCVRAARAYATAMPTHELETLSDGQQHLFVEGAIRIKTCLAQVVEDQLGSGTEMQEIRIWITQIDEFLAQEDTEAQARAALAWLQPAVGEQSKEAIMQRYHAFLVFHDPMLPPLTDPLVDQGRFLMELRTGLRLCLIFNHFVNSSTKPFGHIQEWHAETSIQWRVTNNLSYWRKAVELRLGLDLSAMNIKSVYTFDETGQSQLLQAVSSFCEAAINEVAQSLHNDTHNR